MQVDFNAGTLNLSRGILDSLLTLHGVDTGVWHKVSDMREAVNLNSQACHNRFIGETKTELKGVRCGKQVYSAD